MVSQAQQWRCSVRLGGSFSFARRRRSLFGSTALLLPRIPNYLLEVWWFIPFLDCSFLNLYFSLMMVPRRWWRAFVDGGREIPPWCFLFFRWSHWRLVLHDLILYFFLLFYFEGEKCVLWSIYLLCWLLWIWSWIYDLICINFLALRFSDHLEVADE